MIEKSQCPNEHLLENQQVLEEIRRHLWIESEKTGYDIGFETAARDWLEKFSGAWITHYMPGKPSRPKAAPAKRSVQNSNPVNFSKMKRPSGRSARKI